jgi:vancomycin resistance protein YoaR
MSSIRYVRRPERARSQQLAEQVLLSLLFGFILFLLGMATIAISYQVLYLGRVFPGVAVAGVDIGGLTTNKATAKISQALTYPETGHILFHDEHESWLVTPGELGLHFNAEATAQAAYKYGRRGGPLQRLLEQFNSWYYHTNLPPVLLFDQRVAYQHLSSLADKINRPLIEASLTVQGVDVVVRSGQVGREVDIPATMASLSTQLGKLEDGAVALVIKESPPVIVDVSEQAKLARAILSEPLTITMPDGQSDKPGPWIIEKASLAALLTFNQVKAGDKTEYQVGLNNETLRKFLNDLAPTLAIDAQNSRFTFNDETRQLEVIQPAVVGRSLNVEASLQSIQEKVIKGEHTVALQFTFTQPSVTDKATGDQLGIHELVQMTTSYFYGSNEARVQNIRMAASRFHGLLVAPGEVFSMASALGDISLDNGYAEALIILGNHTITGVGGGVCQVSTTLFRTAFFAGYPIIERHPHAYRVYYYEKVAGNKVNPDLAGLDATVFVPLVDFKFKNDSPNWILMETYVNASTSSITWKFYSTKDGRTVEWHTTGPQDIVDAPDPEYTENPDLPKGEIKQVDWAADGADVTVNRSVSRDGTAFIEDTFITHYEPWQAKYEYGPGTELPTPTP